VQWGTSAVHVRGLAESDIARRNVCDNGDGHGHDDGCVAGIGTAVRDRQADEHEGSADAIDTWSTGNAGAGGRELGTAAARTTLPVGAHLRTGSAGVLGDDDEFMWREWRRRREHRHAGRNVHDYSVWEFHIRCADADAHYEPNSDRAVSKRRLQRFEATSRTVSRKE